MGYTKIRLSGVIAVNLTVLDNDIQHWRKHRMVILIHKKANVIFECFINGPLTRYVKLLVAHAPGMPGTVSPPPGVSYPDMHHGTCVTHVPWCMPGSLTSGFYWSQWRGKRSRYSRYMCNPHSYVSGKRAIVRIPSLTNNGSECVRRNTPDIMRTIRFCNANNFVRYEL